MKKITLLLIAFFVFISCQKNKSDESETGPKVVLNTPVGEAIPIDADGVTVMFDKPVAALTTLNQQNLEKVDLNITPHVKGRLSLLGTKGFIYRFDEPLKPATEYEVEIPDNNLEWKFSTVVPQVKMLSPNENDSLASLHASLKVDFNMAMDIKDVERQIKVVDFKTKEEIRFKASYNWLNGNRTLVLIFETELPSNTNLEVVFPKGLKSAYGSLVSKNEFKRKLFIWPNTFNIQNVGVDYSSQQIKMGQSNIIEVGNYICYEFSQPVKKESLIKSFKAKKSEEKNYIKKINFYFSDYDSLSYYEKDGKYKRETGVLRACAGFAEEYHQKYELNLDVKKIETISQALFSGENPVYQIQTSDAKPELYSSQTKTILSYQSSKQLPFDAINLKSVDVKLYPLVQEQYSENVLGRKIIPDTEWDKKTRQNQVILPYQMTLNSQLVLPLSSVMTIDNEKLQPIATGIINLENKKNIKEYFKIKIDEIFDNKKIDAGFYLIEVNGKSDSEVNQTLVSLVQITPYAIAIQREVDHVLVWVTDIETGQPIPDLPVKIKAYSYDNGILLSEDSITNQFGVAISQNNWSGKYVGKDWTETREICVESLKENHASYSCEGMHSLSYRDVLSQGDHYFAYLYTDRPIYRPGQTVHFSSFVRQVKEARYFMPDANQKYMVTATDAAGNQIYKKEDITANTGGIISGSFDLSDAEDISRGDYEISISVGNQQMIKKFVVASYKKPSFKVDVKVEKEEIVSKEKITAAIKGSYFFGSPLSHAKTEWSLMTTTYQFRPEGFENYSFVDTDLVYKKDSPYFDDYDYYTEYEYDTVLSEDASHWDDPRIPNSSDSYSPMPSGLYQDDKNQNVEEKNIFLNKNGELVVNYSPDISRYPVSQVLTFEASVADQSHQQVSAIEDIVVHKADFYLGISPEKWVYSKNENAKFNVVSLDTKGKILGDQSFKLELVKRDYQLIERQNSNGIWEMIHEPKDTLIQTKKSQTNEKGLSQVEMKIPQSGTYRLVLTGEDENNNQINAATTIYAWGEDYVPWKINEAQKIELVPDKDFYKIGETAKILIKSILPLSKALVTLGRGRLLEYDIKELGGNANAIEIPVTLGMIPNLYIHVIAHVGRDETHSPMLFHGSTELKIDPHQKRLAIEISTDKKTDSNNLPSYKPGEEVKVKIKTSNALGTAEPASVIVSVADESVLKLLNYRLPDLVDKFYFNRPYKIKTSSSMNSLKSGDGSTGASSKKRRLFKDTAHFEKVIQTNSEGVAEFSFKLPENLTTWVIEAVGISHSKTFEDFEKSRQANSNKTKAHQKELNQDLTISDNTYVGSQREKIQVTLPYLISLSLPRFASWGDELNAQALVVNRTAQDFKGSIDIKMDKAGKLEDETFEKKIDVTLKANEQKAIPVKIKVQSNFNKLVMSLMLKDENGIDIDGVEKTLALKDRYQPEIVATNGMTTQKEMEKVDLPQQLNTDKGNLTISLNATMALALAEPLKNLIDYPYGCSEQRSSSLLALMMSRSLGAELGEKFLDKLVPVDKNILKNKNLFEKLELIDLKIQNIIEDLTKNFITSEGGISYWPLSENASIFSSVQVFWAFNVAQKLGYVVDENIKQQLSSYLLKQIASQDVEMKTQSYILWALSLEGVWDFAVAEKLSNQIDNMSVTDLAYTLMAFDSFDKNQKLKGETGVNPNKILQISKRIESLATHHDRYVKWDASDFYVTSQYRNTALAALALLENNDKNPLILKSLSFLLNRKTDNFRVVTQDDLHLSYLAYRYLEVTNETKTDFKTFVSIEDKKYLEANYQTENILETKRKTISLKELSTLKQPMNISFNKEGEGNLYYNMLLKYYLPSNQAPTREEGLIISREIYDLDDVEEKNPLTKFEVGKNYKGHITLVVPDTLNYVMIHDLLPAGFEPIDVQLATTSKADFLKSQQNTNQAESPYNQKTSFDDIVENTDFGMDYAFSHTEIRDDSLLFSDEYLPKGVYHIRYPVRAATSGNFLMSGATAFEFYEPEIFGRSQTKMIQIVD